MNMEKNVIIIIIIIIICLCAGYTIYNNFFVILRTLSKVDRIQVTELDGYSISSVFPGDQVRVSNLNKDSSRFKIGCVRD